MITYEQLERLIGFPPDGLLVSSLYVPLPGGSAGRTTARAAVLPLLRKRKASIEEADLSRIQRESVRKDFEHLERFLRGPASRFRGRGLALFVCSGQGLAETWSLPRRVPEMLVVGPAPHIRPLTAVLDDFHRYCTVVVGPRRARILEMYMGEIEARCDVRDEVPARVRTGGWHGFEERRMERHVDDRERRHHARVAETLAPLFRRHHCDWLLLAGPAQAVRDFQAALPRALKERVRGTFSADPQRTPDAEILRRSLEMEAQVERENERRLVRDLLERAGNGGLAVVGLPETIEAFEEGEVHSLVVTDGFAAPGVRCPKCGALSADREECAACGVPTDEVPDVVEALLEKAWDRHMGVEVVAPEAGLAREGHVGAILGYRRAS